jgi:hypothetical protein
MDLGRMFLLGTSNVPVGNVGGRRTMWRMSNAQAMTFIAVVVIAVVLLLMLLA